MEIRDKVVVVTGAASGIGAGLAQRFVLEGAHGVVVADVNLERAQGVAQGIGAQAIAVRCDVSQEAEIRPWWRRRATGSAALTSTSPTPASSGAWAGWSWTTPCGTACGRSTAWPTCGRRAPWCRRWSRAAKAISSSRPRLRAC